MCTGTIIERDVVGELLEKSITSFTNEIDKVNSGQCNILTIDTDCEDTEGKPYLKIVNETLHDAYAVYLDTIADYHKQGAMEHLVKSLKTGEFMVLHGITRIVGYYSRIQNWNSSKLSELRDRRIGNYWEKSRVNTEQLVGIGEK